MLARKHTLIRVVLLALALSAVACGGGGRTAAEAQSDLASENAKTRLKASRDIETEAKKTTTLPPNVLEQLLEMAKNEPDKQVKGSVMIALGYTGDKRAGKLIEDYLQTEDPDQQRWATRAWSWYLIRTGKYEEGHKFPAHFPYGTEGYPPPAK